MCIIFTSSYFLPQDHHYHGQIYICKKLYNWEVLNSLLTSICAQIKKGAILKLGLKLDSVSLQFLSKLLCDVFESPFWFGQLVKMV